MVSVRVSGLKMRQVSNGRAIATTVLLYSLPSHENTMSMIWIRNRIVERFNSGAESITARCISSVGDLYTATD